MKLRFYSLGSGSSGNCYYIANDSFGLLIDAGISTRAICRFMKEMNIPIETIMGVLITHNHSDHIKGLDVLTRRCHLPAYTTCNVRKSILGIHWKNSNDAIKEIPMQKKFQLAGFDIEAFPVNHDAPETIGFHICLDNKKITIATDLGHICQTSAGYIKKANILVIESNYDSQMLNDGPYPYYLKKRIKSDNGHLGNDQVSSFLADNMNQNLSHICLAHLSKNNNTPEKALDTLQQTFTEKGTMLYENQSVIVLNRSVSTRIIETDI